MTLFIPITKIDKAKRLVYGRITQEIPDKSGEILDYESSKPAFQKWSDEQFKASGGKSKGNLRAMHDKIAAGVFVDLRFDDEQKAIEGCAKVVDDDEWEKVETGTYTGFSIGGGYAKRWIDPENPNLKRYTPDLAEVSLVDNPCVPTATFEVIKEDGSIELRKFNTNQEAPMTDTTNKAPESDQADAVEKAAAADGQETAAGDEAGQDGSTELKKDGKAAAAEPPHTRDGVRQRWLAKDNTEYLTKAEAMKRNQQIEAEAIAAPALEALKKLDDAVAKAEGKEPGADATAEGDAKAAEAAGDAPAAEKAAPAEEVKKGMYTVSTFAQLLQSVQCLQQDSEWEALFEGDSSELPAKLKAWLAEGGTLLVQMVGEETAELTAEKAAAGVSQAAEAMKDLAKKGAKLSAASKEHIEKMYKSACDHMDEVAKCYKALGMCKDDEGDEGDAEKMAKLASESLEVENATLRKALGDITPKLESLLVKFEEQGKRIAHLESQPMPAKGALRVVDKSNDGSNAQGGDDVTKAAELLKGMSKEQVSMVLMKTALANPVAVTSK